ncbi:DUF1573 domain-containing protein [Hymenobacter sp. BT770]|uniref:DUF1573 domain-containing protein n=1 Tax=Hymenobacter sp. BT770 TaxID=2886942 RepID=UPI001D11320F|nr:DUF1573 domain-containing protein [Hymenobacter sp. BT770]MCC3152356.1 DUF1573 domain-containing protein [Hymenobacter sp. BT770]MDO3414169.1 DUF1573 domain-containing protein [Hymenobacter sp. BT770]
MKKTLLLALSLTAAAYTAQAQATAPATKAVGPVAGPAITFEESKYDFGSVVQGGTVDHTFKFKNTGTAPLVISNIGVSCGCTTPEWTKVPVLPGKTGSITAHFNSTGKMGMQNKVLTIESNAAAGSTTVSLVGEVKEAPATANSATTAAAGSTAAPVATDVKKVKEKTTASKVKAKVK